MQPLHAWRTIRALVVALIALGCVGGTAPHVSHAQEDDRPNFLIILTDDQHTGTLRSMPSGQRLIARKGIRFPNAFVTNPLCCPSRASILTGSYSHTNGVYSNGGLHGGTRAFIDHGNEPLSVAPALQDSGYRTGLVGKYLNLFRNAVPPDYVPPGWSRFVTFYENSGLYYDYDLSVDGVTEHRGGLPSDYSTDVLRRHAVRFLRSKSEEPFFLLFAPYAPHGPATPAPRHLGDLAGMPDYSSASLNERDVSDKPGYIRRSPLLSPRAEHALQHRIRRRAESLLAVDEAVEAMVSVLREQNELRETVIVFLSDNGLGWGDHRWKHKLVPYEGSIGIPFAIRYDPLTHARAGSANRKLVLNIDLVPTFLDLAGVVPPSSVDGQSLVPLLRGDTIGWRNAFLIENLYIDRGDSGSVPTYCAIRTDRWKYVVYDSDFRELYDLRRDPYELTNVARSRDRVRRRLHARLETLCDPRPPDYSALD
jgi:N-acetylglucosamine-6-sulfatase